VYRPPIKVNPPQFENEPIKNNKIIDEINPNDNRIHNGGKICSA